jgi:uncharacterized protein
MRRIARGLLILAVCLYAIAGCALYSFQRELLYPGTHNTVPADIPQSPGLEAFHVQTSSGPVDAWYLPPLTPRPTFPALIFGHGNGEVIDMWVGGLDEFRRWGMAIMLVEYPGYGRSRTIPSEKGIREAMVGAYDILSSRPGVDTARIVGYGQSLGGGAICTLARERHLAAMVLQSTFTSIRPFAHRYFMPAFLVVDVFDNAEVVQRFDGPVLLLHGRHDGLIPPTQAETLARVARQSELQFYECGHFCWYPNDLPIYRDMKAFFEQNGVLPPVST